MSRARSHSAPNTLGNSRAGCGGPWPAPPRPDQAGRPKAAKAAFSPASIAAQPSTSVLSQSHRIARGRAAQAGEGDAAGVRSAAGRSARACRRSPRGARMRAAPVEGEEAPRLPRRGSARSAATSSSGRGRGGRRSGCRARRDRPSTTSVEDLAAILREARRARPHIGVEGRRGRAWSGRACPGTSHRACIRRGIRPRGRRPPRAQRRRRRLDRSGLAHAAFRSSPFTCRANSSNSRRITGPTVPSPTGLPSIVTIGFTKQVAQVMKASRARAHLLERRTGRSSKAMPGLAASARSARRGCSRAG